MNRDIHPIHPGEILREEFMLPLGVTQYRLAKAIGVPPRRINEIVHENRGISVNTALRLAKFFGTDAQSWINLQSSYEREIAEEQLAATLAAIQPLAA